MQLFLGIDGGGTGCRAAVADASGRILARAEAGPANIASDLPGAMVNILRAADHALTELGAQPSMVRAGLGLAGANAAGVAEQLAATLPFAVARVVTDAVTAVMGALGEGDGIVAAMGTGSVFGVQRGGVVRQMGGRGLAMGDEGSGAWIGRAILARALRAVDGLEDMTPLLRALIDEAGGDDRVVAYSLTARPADYAALAPRVLTSGDAAAEAVMQAATDHVAAAVAVLQAGQDLPVVFLGGLGPTFAARLAGRWPIRPALGTALDGALRLARRDT
ncbi:BadF/BadG/BcrA/BcrD ATPase family protein [Fuscibacter oryzae]|uniref:ATPase n=1 Tax=Fuscibacter oryzae TaxID=2803939 RepID=A0A8J7MM30_9RHOB|nr:BadF/BadG/BcrA/BcrD ATPase family protein [Fuscibacter oryzae]MBL4927315.1 ATPase [Fuscibacter oryzae]